jgi:hypothetical protein
MLTHACAIASANFSQAATVLINVGNVNQQAAQSVPARHRPLRRRR